MNAPATQPRMSDAERERRNMIRQDIAAAIVVPFADDETAELIGELRAIEAETEQSRR